MFVGNLSTKDNEFSRESAEELAIGLEVSGGLSLVDWKMRNGISSL
jgi:hypothetical protein